jgi:hypothetical protein
MGATRQVPGNDYRSFVLRCQPEMPAPGETPGWCLTLHEVGGLQRGRAFRNVEDLVSYLERELAGRGALSGEDTRTNAAATSREGA